MRVRGMVYPALLVLLASQPLRAQAQERPFTTQDAVSVRTARILDVTDDGRWVAAWVQTRADRSDVDHFRFGDPTYVAPSSGELLVLDAESGVTKSVFAAKEQIQGGEWSPDGRRLAFLRLQGGAWRLNVYEPSSGRVRAVTLRSSKEIAGGSSLTWAPDGGSLLLSLRPEGWAEGAREAFLELTEGPIVIQDSGDDFLDWDRVRGLDREQLPALVRLSDGAVTELPVAAALQDPHFGKDGTYLVFGTAEPRRTAYERAKGTWYGVFRVALDGGTGVDTLLAPREQRVSVQWNDQATAFAWAERGNVWVRALDADSAVNVTETHRTPLSEEDTTKLSFSMEGWRPDGSAVLLSSKKGYHVLDVAAGSLETVLELQGDEDARPRLSLEAWSADGGSVFFGTSARDRWERGLARLDVASHELKDLVRDAGLYADWNVSADGRRVVYRRSDGDRPDEVWASDVAFTAPRELTDLNPQLDGVALTRTELVEYLDVDGNRLYGVLYYPRGYEPGKKYPLVAEIYETFFDNGYNENMNLVTARGWFGFRPSVDLETGYPGEAWLKGVTPAINVLIERGLVDEKQLGVYGQSYGGYAVNLLVTQTDRFAAAVNVSGKVNIISFLGDSEKITTRNYNAAEEGQDRIGATLWEQPQKYVAHSAIMFADRIKTPLLLLSGEGDWNVPATNQREMYYALRRLGKEVVWVNYMKGGHGAGRASSVEDFHDHWRRLLDWMGDHFEKARGDKAVKS